MTIAVRRSRAERETILASAGFNVWNLDPADVEIDLLTDIPPRSFVESVAAAAAAGATADVREPDLSAAAQAVYGEARYVWTSRGRSAELALVAALDVKGAVILTHGLWRTTERALALKGNRIEQVPRAKEAGTANLDLARLATRLDAGGVHSVFIEPANGQLAGWTIDIENVREISRLCRKSGALLLVDATRLLANCAALGGAPVESAAEFLRLADAFTVSCPKESFVPVGGLVGVRDRASEQRAFLQAFLEGSSLEPLSARTQVAAGLRYLAAHPEALLERRRLLGELASRLKKAGLPIVEPIGAHAVFVEIEEGLLKSSLSPRVIEGLLYLNGGVRATLSHNTLLDRHLVRLILPLARFGDRDVEHIATSMVHALDEARDPYLLEPAPGEPPLFEIFSRFSRRSS
jgi:tryptophanase